MELKLPPYLGFGKLDPQSVKTQAGATCANYVLENEVVYQALIKEDDCKLSEFFKGEVICKTSGTDLQPVFMQHLAKMSPYQHPRFEETYRRICDGRNIFARFARQPDMIYFPAGYLFALRLPVVEGNYKKYLALKKQLDKEAQDLPLAFHAERPGLIFRLMDDGEVRGEEVAVVDFSAKLLDLVSAADWLWQSQVVPQQKAYRLTVLPPSETTPGNLPIYFGEPGKGLLTFSVIVTEGLETPLEEVAKKFFELSNEFLESMRKKS